MWHLLCICCVPDTVLHVSLASSHHMLTMALCEAVIGGVSRAIPTSYFYVKGFQLEDIPVFSLQPVSPPWETCIFFCAM